MEKGSAQKIYSQQRGKVEDWRQITQNGEAVKCPTQFYRRPIPSALTS